MRILLALDGSSSADAARELVGSLAWPSGSVVQVVAVAEPAAELLTPLVVAAPTIGSYDEQTTEDLEQLLDAAVATLERPTLAVEHAVLHGRPATLIVERAAEFRAELVVIGSRGRGPLTTMLLGSVSAEVVDHAPCPVLVVRGPVADNVLVAVDGSPSSQSAITYLTANRILANRPVEVLTVAAGSDRGDSSTLGVFSDVAFDVFEEERRNERRHAEDIAAAAARRLSDEGYHARWSISTGHAAHEIIEAARCFGSGLIVVGSRGHTGLTRILLGSVARNVLLHTHASVLIVREPIRTRWPERTRREEERPVREPVGAGAH
jgi:nucleotide-binding universal stress UspA family protein